MDFLKRALAALFVLTILALPSPAHADEPTAPTTRSWYGWQTLVADGASILVFATAVGATSPGAQEALGFSALGGYVLGGPVVHAAHGRGGAFAASLGLRLGAPLLLGGTAALLIPHHGGDDLAWGLGIAGGIISGMITAIVLDAALIGFEEVPREDTAKLRVVPQVGVMPGGGGSVGLAGTF